MPRTTLRSQRLRYHPARLLRLSGTPLAVAIAVAGCGASSQSGSATTNHKQMAARDAKATHSAGDSMSHHMMAGGEAHAMPVFAHAELTLRSSQYGPVIFDQNHTALYVFSADNRSTSSCYGACQAAWPPLLTKQSPRAATGLNPSLLGTTRRKDGSQQVTYAGHPLYFYSGDKGSSIGCQHVKLHGGYWYVLGANGSPDLAKGKAM